MGGWGEGHMGGLARTLLSFSWISRSLNVTRNIAVFHGDEASFQSTIQSVVQASRISNCDLNYSPPLNSVFILPQHGLFKTTTKNWLDNCRFNPAWTDKYLFILPPSLNDKLMCLLCNVWEPRCGTTTHATLQHPEDSIFTSWQRAFFNDSCQPLT